jgi:hypothetical protein
MKTYQIHYWASKPKQKLRLAADIPQSLDITDLSHAHLLRSLVLFFFLGWKHIRYIIQHLNIIKSWDWQLILLNLWGLQTFLAHIFLGASLFCYSFLFGMKIYQIPTSRCSLKSKIVRNILGKYNILKILDSTLSVWAVGFFITLWNVHRGYRLSSQKFGTRSLNNSLHPSGASPLVSNSSTKSPYLNIFGFV